MVESIEYHVEILENILGEKYGQIPSVNRKVTMSDLREIGQYFPDSHTIEIPDIDTIRQYMYSVVLFHELLHGFTHLRYPAIYNQQKEAIRNNKLNSRPEIEAFICRSAMMEGFAEFYTDEALIRKYGTIPPTCAEYLKRPDICLVTWDLSDILRYIEPEQNELVDGEILLDAIYQARHFGYYYIANEHAIGGVKKVLSSFETPITLEKMFEALVINKHSKK